MVSAMTSDDFVSTEGNARKQRITLVVIVALAFIVGNVVVSLAAPPNPPGPPGPNVIIDGLDDILVPETAFNFNSSTEQLEGAGSDAFLVRIVGGAMSGIVDITSVTDPITKDSAGQPAGSASSLSAGCLSAHLSRYDLIVTPPRRTDVTLTVWIRVPITVAAGTYAGGSVGITATATF